MRKGTMKWAIIITLLILAGIVAIDRISPYDQTVSTMLVIEKRIINYLNENDKLPGSLTELPKLSNYENSITDGWGKEILYQYDSKEQIISLYSCGSTEKDAQKGRPIVKRMKIKKENGKWKGMEELQ